MLLWWASYLRARSDPPVATARRVLRKKERKPWPPCVHMTCSCLPVLEARTWWIHQGSVHGAASEPHVRDMEEWTPAVVALTQLNACMHPPTSPYLSAVRTYVRAFSLVLTPGNEMEGGHTIKTTVPFCTNACAIQNSENSMDKILLPPSSPSGKKNKVPV
jgi:hypothetical protein